MKKRKTPMRMCVGCREMKDKRTLLRIVRGPDGIISADRTGKAPGRGAYLCPERVCLQKARKICSLERALEGSVSDEVFACLERELDRRELL